MKKFHLFSLIIFLVSNAGRLSAQNKTTLPNNGLTHSMSTSEQFEMRNSGNNFRITSPPAAPVRNIAEFEPAEAVIIAYVGGFGIPGTVIKDLSNTGKVIIIAATSDQSTVTSLLSSYGANTANCSFLTATIDSWWTRDYSGWFIADSSNKVQVVDFTYNRPRPNDDSLTKYEATLLGITYYGMNLVTTGGNYMCDGYNDAVSTVLVEQDNTTLDSTQIRLFASEYLGINNYMIRPDPLGQYIEHIDCWGKYLAPDKILIDSVPSGDPQYSVYEACAAYFASTNCPYGYKYKVYRPLIAGSSTSAATEPYSNTFIFNNRVFVPINGGTTSTNDTAALKLYRKAMPGYTVKAYTASGSQAW
ncbi:MAG: agmatine deiminase family protein, partial [Bacteroidales bacterium]